MSNYLGLITTIVGAILGAVLNEAYKRHRDAVAASAAIAGELASYLSGFESLKLSLQVLISRVTDGGSLLIPDQSPAKDTAYDAYVDKIGLLGPVLAEQVAAVYGGIRGFRAALYPVAGDKKITDPAYTISALNVAEMFASRASKEAVPLIAALRSRAHQSFVEHVWSTWPFTRRREPR